MIISILYLIFGIIWTLVLFNFIKRKDPISLTGISDYIELRIFLYSIVTIFWLPMLIVFILSTLFHLFLNLYKKVFLHNEI